MMKVLLTTGLFPPDIGGPATYVPRMAEALAGRGHVVTIVAPQERGVPCPIVAPPYRLVRFYRAHTLRYANFFIELWRAFVAVLREARACDVLFVNGLDLPAAWAARLTGKPMVVKVVGDGAWELAHTRGWTRLNLEEFQGARGLRIGFFRLLRHAAAKRAQAVIVPSRYLARIVEGWGVQGCVRVVYNALDLPSTGADALPDITLPPAFERGFRLATVGRLVPHKRIADVVAAVARLDGARLLIVGDGPQRSELEALVENLGLADRVLMVGGLPQQELWGMLVRYADVLVLNSTYEGLPHILLEAAHLGLPVVATAVGGTPEIVEDGESGLLIPPDSPAALLAALRRLQADPALRRRLAEGARRTAARFSFEHMVEETEAVLKLSIGVR
ncbi:MAG: glycosyltransferase family 4 protein [Anaerolineae bacterium]|nr:glycosyltransferase family 4 protein [Anaerolineae bacterium]